MGWTERSGGSGLQEAQNPRTSWGAESHVAIHVLKYFLLLFLENVQFGQAEKIEQSLAGNKSLDCW